MKKFLLAVVIVLVLAVPAVAEAPVTVLVDGKALNTPGLLINDTTYVPLRAVSESLGAKVEWDGRAIISTLGRPVITGDESQKAKVEAALQLLQEKDPADYELVCRYVKELIIEAKPFGNDYLAGIKSATSSIRLSPTLMGQNNIPFLASCIVHEAAHLSNGKYYIIHRQTDENIAYLREIATMRILGVSQQLIDGTEAARLRVIK
jgi:hypothetical protein